MNGLCHGWKESQSHLFSILIYARCWKHENLSAFCIKPTFKGLIEVMNENILLAKARGIPEI